MMRFAVLLLSILLLSCHVVLPLGEPPPDSGRKDAPEADAARPDRSLDGPASDVPPPKNDLPGADTQAPLDLPVTPAAPRPVWTRVLGGDKGHTTGGHLAVDSAGNIIVVGGFEGTMSFNGVKATGKKDIFVVKYSGSGQVIWSMVVGGAGNDDCRAAAVDSAGDVYLVGRTDGGADFGKSKTTSLKSLYIVSLEGASGAARWVEFVNGPAFPTGVAVDGAALYAAGYYSGAVNFGSGTRSSSGQDIFVLRRAAATGNKDWDQTYGSPGSDAAEGVAARSGQVYVTGRLEGTTPFKTRTLSTSGGDDIFLLRLAANGDTDWVKGFGSTLDEQGEHVAVDGQSNVWVTGVVMGPVSLGGPPITPISDKDVFVASYTSGGQHRWSRAFGGTMTDVGECIAADSLGNVYVTGYTSKSPVPIDFGGGPLPGIGLADLFIASFTSTGKHRWSEVHGAASGEFGRAVGIDLSGGVTFAGTTLSPTLMIDSFKIVKPPTANAGLFVVHMQ